MLIIAAVFLDKIVLDKIASILPLRQKIFVKNVFKEKLAVAATLKDNTALVYIVMRKAYIKNILLSLCKYVSP